MSETVNPGSAPEANSNDQNNNELLMKAIEAFQGLQELIGSPAVVALNFVKRALETEEGKSFIANALANNIEFRQLMEAPPKMPEPNFDELDVMVKLPGDESKIDPSQWTPVRLYPEDDIVYPGRLLCYLTGPEGLKPSTMVPQIEAKVLARMAEAGIGAGQAFYVSVIRVQMESPEVPAVDGSSADHPEETIHIPV